MATPLLKDLKSAFPNVKITAMCQGIIGDLLVKDPHIDEIFQFSRPSGWIHRVHNRHILNPIHHGEFDTGLLTTNSFSSAWWFFRGGVKRRIGFRSGIRAPLLTDPLPFPEDRSTSHQVGVYKKLLQPFGIEPSKTLPYLTLTDDELAAAKEELQRLGTEGQTIVGVNPGAAYGSAKCWPPERFRDLAKKFLEEKNYSLLFFGDQKTAPLVEEVTAGLGNRAINLAGRTTLRELMALIASCDLFLTNDSGPMHIASALQRPLVALFGSTSEVKTGPYYGETVIHKHPSCSPCFKRTCPIDFRCMKQISVDEVYRELVSLLP